MSAELARPHQVQIENSDWQFPEKPSLKPIEGIVTNNMKIAARAIDSGLSDSKGAFLLISSLDSFENALRTGFIPVDRGAKSLREHSVNLFPVKNEEIEKETYWAVDFQAHFEKLRSQSSHHGLGRALFRSKRRKIADGAFEMPDVQRAVESAQVAIPSRMEYHSESVFEAVRTLGVGYTTFKQLLLDYKKHPVGLVMMFSRSLREDIQLVEIDGNEEILRIRPVEGIPIRSLVGLDSYDRSSWLFLDAISRRFDSRV